MSRVWGEEKSIFVSVILLLNETWTNIKKEQLSGMQRRKKNLLQ